MSGVTEVRLYRNTVDEVPAEYTDVTAAVLNSSTKNHATGVKRYLDGVTTVSGLDPGTNYFWVELIDARGNTAGPQPAGYVRTRNEILDTKIVDHGYNIVAEGDTIKFNGSNSYARFVDIGEEGVDYGEYVRSGTWSMTFWIKPLVDPSEEIRFLVLRQYGIGITHITNVNLGSLTLTQTAFDLAKNTWHFFALSVDEHQWTMHKSINGLPLESAYIGEWNISSMASDRMFIGANNDGASRPSSWNPAWWDGYATKVTIDDRPLTWEEVTAIYNATNPVD
jgi:hypothetical protein